MNTMLMIHRATASWIGIMILLASAIASTNALAQQPNDLIREKTEMPALEKIQETGKAKVIIILKDENITRTTEGTDNLERKKQTARDIEERFLSGITIIRPDSSPAELEIDQKEPRDLKLEKTYNIVPAIAGEIRIQGLEKIAASPTVSGIYLDKPVKALYERRDALAQIRANLSQAIVRDNQPVNGAGKTMCILDTGIDYNNSEFTGRYVGGYDYINDDNDPWDDYYHGTFVSGIAHAAAPNASIAAVKVLDSGGNGDMSGIMAGIDWCVSHRGALNITVISMSLGTTTQYNSSNCPHVDDSFFNAAANAGIMLVASSGNDGSSWGVTYPACAVNTTAVGAVNSNDNISVFTNRGELLDLLAPGESINSTTLDNGYTIQSGTSAAAPFVSGAATLMYQYSDMQGINITPVTIETAMKTTGVNLFGWSRLDSYAAIMNITLIPISINITSLNIMAQDKNTTIIEITLLNNGNSSLDNITWRVAYGDGTTEQNAEITTLTQNESAKILLNHAYNQTITYNLTINASSNGANSTTSKEINMQAMSVTSLVLTGQNNKSRTFEATLFNPSTEDKNALNWTFEPNAQEHETVRSAYQYSANQQETVKFLIEYDYGQTNTTVESGFTVYSTSENTSKKINVTLNQVFGSGDLNLTRFQTIERSQFNATFEAIIENPFDNITWDEWTLDTGESNISSLIAHNLSNNETVVVLALYNYSRFGQFSPAIIINTNDSAGSTSVNITELNVKNLSSLTETGLNRVFELFIQNIWDATETADWTFNTGEGQVNAQQPTSTQPGDGFIMLFEHEYGSAQNRTITAMAKTNQSNHTQTINI